jgi:hypothetical protein
MIVNKEHNKQATGKGAHAKARGQCKGGSKVQFYCTENIEACCHAPGILWRKSGAPRVSGPTSSRSSFGTLVHWLSTSLSHFPDQKEPELRVSNQLRAKLQIML